MIRNILNLVRPKLVQGCEALDREGAGCRYNDTDATYFDIVGATARTMESPMDETWTVWRILHDIVVGTPCPMHDDSFAFRRLCDWWDSATPAEYEEAKKRLRKAGEKIKNHEVDPSDLVAVPTATDNRLENALRKSRAAFTKERIGK